MNSERRGHSHSGEGVMWVPLKGRGQRTRPGAALGRDSPLHPSGWSVGQRTFSLSVLGKCCHLVMCPSEGEDLQPTSKPDAGFTQDASPRVRPSHSGLHYSPSAALKVLMTRWGDPEHTLHSRAWQVRGHRTREGRIEHRDTEMHAIAYDAKACEWHPHPLLVQQQRPMMRSYKSQAVSRKPTCPHLPHRRPRHLQDP